MIIAILMPIFKPRYEFLYEQIASIASQKGVITKLYCVIADLQSKAIVVEIADALRIEYEIFMPTNRLGVTDAIMFGMKTLLDSQRFSYLAICDQDDIWLPNKLRNQIEFLEMSHSKLTYSDAVVVNDINMNEAGSMHEIERRPKDPNMYNLATGNIGTGMTFLMSHDFARLVLPYMQSEHDHILHDYQMMMVGSLLGKVKFDQRCLVRYRQHSGNHTGVWSFKKMIHKVAKKYQDYSADNRHSFRKNSDTKGGGIIIGLQKIYMQKNVMARLVRDYLRKQRERLYFIKKLEWRMLEEKQKEDDSCIYSSPGRFVVVILRSVYKGRLFRALNAMIILWFIFTKTV